jgi:protease-4
MAKRSIAIIFTLLGIAFVLSIGGVIVVYLLLGREPSVPRNATLTLEIGGDLAETAPGDVVGYLRGSSTPTVKMLVDNLRKAKVDRRVGAVFLKLTGFSTPYWAKIQEIREAVVDFKASGKPVYAYMVYGGDRDYYLATAADKVFLMPSSPLDFSGVANYAVFLRGTLDKFGVYPDLHHIGDYKTASNQFTEKGYTPAHREMDESLNRDLFDQIVHDVATGRKRGDDEVRALVDQGPFLPEPAMRAGLIDGAVYEDEAEQALRDLDKDRKPSSFKGEDYARVSLSSLGLNRGPRIAVIYAAGAITGGKSGYDPLNGSTMGSETLVESIRAARKDTSLKAMILRIDSPGGSAAASDEIWHELMLVKKERPSLPIVASMSDLAASGGYYIAMPADVIVAQPATLTGSIGIFGGKFVTGGLYEQLGANIGATSIGKHAEMNSPARPFNADETKKVDEQLKAFYDDFVKRAAESRHTTFEKIDSLARGRVWTGLQAKENGLVDEVGGLSRAVAMAKDRAKIAADSEVELITYPAPKGLYELLTEQLSGSSSTETAIVDAWLGQHLSDLDRQVLRAARGPATLFRPGEALALMPFAYVR